MRKTINSKAQVPDMKRIVSSDRVPEPIGVSIDEDSIKDEIVDISEELSSHGYGQDFMYQLGGIMPPAEDSSSIVENLDRNAIYVNVLGSGEEGRKTEQFYPEYTIEGIEYFQDVANQIEQVVDELGYDLEFWSVSGISTSACSGSEIVDNFDDIGLQATAAVDAGLESQRGKEGFKPIRIGWFYRAPMDKTMEFGYRAFPNREFQYSPEDYEDSNELINDVLARITGNREEETNEHNLYEEEISVLRDLEEGLQSQGLL